MANHIPIFDFYCSYDFVVRNIPNETKYYTFYEESIKYATQTLNSTISLSI